MKINVFIERKNENALLEMKEGTSIKDLLALLEINPVTIIPVKNGEVVIEDAKLKDKDTIKLMSVVSGG